MDLDKPKKIRRKRKIKEIKELNEELETIPIKDLNQAITEASEAIDYPYNIWIYRGSLKQISIDGVLYINNVPTHVTLGKELKIKDLKDFSKYDGGGVKSPYPILIKAPSELEDFLACLTAVQRVRDCYPKADIVVNCAPKYNELLPSWAKSIRHTSNKMTYLKSFDFSGRKMASYWFTNFNLSFMNKALLYIQSAELFYPRDKVHLKIYKSEKKISGKKTLVLHRDDSLKSCILDVLGDYIDYINIKDFDENNVMSILSKYRSVVSTLDNQIVGLASYLGIRTLIFIDESKFKRQTQLAMFGAGVAPYPTFDKMAETTADIRRFIKNGS